MKACKTPYNTSGTPWNSSETPLDLSRISPESQWGPLNAREFLWNPLKSSKNTLKRNWNPPETHIEACEDPLKPRNSFCNSQKPKISQPFERPCHVLKFFWHAVEAHLKACVKPSKTTRNPSEIHWGVLKCFATIYYTYEIPWNSTEALLNACIARSYPWKFIWNYPHPTEACEAP